MDAQQLCSGCGRVLMTGAAHGVCELCLRKERPAEPYPVPSAVVPPLLTSTFEPVFSGIPDVPGGTPYVLLRDSDVEFGPDPVVQPNSPEMPREDDKSTQLQLLGEIARGGMGAILKGRDRTLGRDLVVKVLLEEHRSKPDLVRRFIEEAQITGQLQHPGIVPVYEMKTFPDRRPYFAMKFVKGLTLAALLKERPHPGHDLSKFLGIFEAVCQTMAYAHSRGVIHRDLKPSNVMVGSFGEVQVMDWGLAKVLPRGGVADDESAGKVVEQETIIATVRSLSDADKSLNGSVLGTPSYMAPEQARGEVEETNERSDVFALGSILCEILTGKPAFIGRDSDEVWRQARRGSLTEANGRLSSCGADAELRALAQHCLSLEPEERPRNAGAVASRLATYRAEVQERLRRAELGRVEERARRRLTTLAAAGVILLSLFGGSMYTWIQRQKAERVAKTARAVDDALADAARLRGEAQAASSSDLTKWGESYSAAKRAEVLLLHGEANAPLRARVTALLAQLDRERADAERRAKFAEANRILMSKLAWIRGNHAEHEDVKHTDDDYAEAFRQAGLDIDQAEPSEGGKWIAAHLDPVELASYLDDWAFMRRNANRGKSDSNRSKPDWKRLVAAARAADPDPWRDALRSRIDATDETALAEFRRLADDAAVDTQPAISLVLLALQLKFGAKDIESAEKILRRASILHPGDFWVHYKLASAPGADFGTVSELFPRPEEAILHLRMAVVLRPRTARIHMLLGYALVSKVTPKDDLRVAREFRPKELEEAISEYCEAIRLKPDYAEAHNALAMALDDQHKSAEAEAEYRKAIQLKPNLAVAHSNLCGPLMSQSKFKEAAASCREAIRLQPDFAAAHCNLGNALQADGELEKAIAAYKEAIRIRPGFHRAHQNLGDLLITQGKLMEGAIEHRKATGLALDAEFYNDLGMSFEKQGRLDEAIVSFREAIRLKPDYAEAYNDFATALQAQGKLDEAVVAYKESIRLKPDYATAYSNLATVLHIQGESAQAIAANEAAVRLEAKAHDKAIIRINSSSMSLDSDLLGASPRTTHHAFSRRRFLDSFSAPPRCEIRLDAETQFDLGAALRAQGKRDEAVAAYKGAIRLKPDHAEAHHELGSTLAAQGKLDEAVLAYHEAVRLKPDDAEAHHDLGVALRAQGKSDEADAAYRDAIRHEPKYAERQHDLGAAFQAEGKLDEAVVAYEDALRLKPDYAAAHNDLGTALQAQGKLREAVTEYRESLRLKPDLAEAHNSLGAAFHAQGKLDQAIKRFREAIRLKPDFAQAHRNLGIVLRGQGKFDEAVVAYQVSIRLKPDFAAPHNSLAWTLANHPDRSRRHPAEALEHARKAAVLAPNDWDIHNTLALTEYRAGHWAESLAASRRSIELDKDTNASNWFFLAMALCRQGDMDQARGFFEKAVAWVKEHDPTNAELLEFWRESAKLLDRPGPDAAMPHITELPVDVFALIPARTDQVGTPELQDEARCF